MRKRINPIFLFLFMAIALFTSCDNNNEDEIWEKINELLQRVQELEKSSAELNSNIHTLQALLEGMKNHIHIVSVEELSDGNGYNIELSDGTQFDIYQGSSAQNTPVIGISQDKEGEYYWTVDGAWIKNENGEPIPANGADNPTPVVKTGNELINLGIKGSWEADGLYLSVNKEKSWTRIPETGGESLFRSVDTSDERYVTFTLSDGSAFSLTRTDAFLALIYGTWQRKTDPEYPVYFTFNKDHTYKIHRLPEEYDGEKSGSFQYIPHLFRLDIYEEGRTLQRPTEDYTVIKVTKEVMILVEDGAMVTFYRVR